MRQNSRKSNIVIAIILFLLAAAFLCYGIYMVSYSMDYIQSYMKISTISFEDALQYVISSSSSYIGFAILMFAGGFITFSLRKTQNISCKKASDTEDAANVEETDIYDRGREDFSPAPLYAAGYAYDALKGDSDADIAEGAPKIDDVNNDGLSGNAADNDISEEAPANEPGAPGAEEQTAEDQPAGEFPTDSGQTISAAADTPVVSDEEPEEGKKDEPEKSDITYREVVIDPSPEAENDIDTAAQQPKYNMSAPPQAAQPAPQQQSVMQDHISYATAASDSWIKDFFERR